MIWLIIALRATPRTAEDLTRAFRFLMLTTRLEPGCLGCTVWSGTDSTVRYEEEWATEADMKWRIRSEAFTSLLSVIEAAEETPHIQLDFVASTRGLDYIAEVREA